MLGPVLKTRTIISSDALHPSAVVAVTRYFIESVPAGSVPLVYIAVGLGTIALLNAMAGVHKMLEALDEAFICNNWLYTILVSFPANTFTRGLTVISTVSVAGFGQPIVSLTERINAVLTFGEAVEIYRCPPRINDAGLQETEEPLPMPPSVAKVPKQIVVSKPAKAVG